MEKTLLITNIHTLVTMDDENRELHGNSIFIRGAHVEALGPTEKMLPFVDHADEVLDGKKLARTAWVHQHTSPYVPISYSGHGTK